MMMIADREEVEREKSGMVILAKHVLKYRSSCKDFSDHAHGSKEGIP